MKLEDKVITGLATSDDDSSITIKDFKAENISSLFEDIATIGISVDMISQTAPILDKISVSFTVPKKSWENVKDSI